MREGNSTDFSIGHKFVLALIFAGFAWHVWTAGDPLLD